MNAATIANDKQPRKQLSDQLDRLDGILDALSDGLNGAVAEAAREGTRLAVKDAIVEMLTDPALRAQLHEATAPTPAPAPAAAESKPGFWSRLKASNASAANYVHCLAHWWASMQARGLHHDLEQQIHYVMAQTYPEVCRCKSLQGVYRDAFLNTKQDKERILSLPEEDRQRINEIVHLRNRFRVKEELDAVLGRFQPPDRVLPVLQEAFRRWAGRGVTLWRQQAPRD